ncbi:hypothetical protein ACWCPS_31140 [Streptomyces mauvecolor]
MSRSLPGCPTRAAVLAALRSAMVRTDPYGPFGGLPAHVRFDRGRDFLPRTVSTALDTDITVLPSCSPYLRGGIEHFNRCVSRMLYAALPGYTPKKQGPGRRCVQRPAAVLSETRRTAGLPGPAPRTSHRPSGGCTQGRLNRGLDGCCQQGSGGAAPSNGHANLDK